MKEVKNGSIYELDGTVPLKQALPLGVQHILAMFLGNISPIIIISGILNMSVETKSILIQNAMFVSGVATLLQLYPIYKAGAKLPIVMGTSSGFLGTAKGIAAVYGYGGILGAALVGSFVQVILGFFIKPLRKLFTPIVTSLVIIAIGLNLLPVGIKYFGGGVGAPDFGNWKHLLVGTIVILVIIIANQFKDKFIKASAVLIGIIVGYVISIALGMVDFTQLMNASWFSLPRPMLVKFEFYPSAIVSMAIMYIAISVETIGNVSGITNGGLGREATVDELRGAVIGDGVGCFLASIFSILPNTCFAQNAGLVSVTKVVNRFVIMTGAVVLILAGFIPKFSAVFSIMPKSVLGGAAVIMFAMILVSGIKALTKNGVDERDSLIIAVSLGIGVGLGNVPDLVSQLPAWVGQIFGNNSIITTFVISTTMNLLLPKSENKTA